LFFSLPNRSYTWHLRATPSVTELVLLTVDLLQTAVFSSGHANDAPSLSSPTHAVDVVFSDRAAAGPPRLLRICARLQLLCPSRDVPPLGHLSCCSSELRETCRRQTTSGSHSHEAAAAEAALYETPPPPGPALTSTAASVCSIWASSIGQLDLK
jgi:hypothetical protein